MFQEGLAVFLQSQWEITFGRERLDLAYKSIKLS